MPINTEIEQFRTRFQKQLESYVLRRLSNAAVNHRDAKKLMRIVAKLVLGPGKRMRPFLTYRTAKRFGVTARSCMPVCIALELFHDFALIHDDIMDRSEKRRGKQTVHELYKDEHRKKDWKGSAEHYGTSCALLAGDLLFAWSEQSFAALNSKYDSLKLRQAWDTLKEEVILGQTLDVTSSVLPHFISRKQVLEIQALKSGRYSIGRPMLIGYALAQASVSEASIMQATEPLGIAFQIQDDILSTFGSPKVTGKTKDADLKEGKLNILTLEARHRLPDDKARVVWNRTFGNPNATTKELDVLRQLIRDSGALNYVEIL
ncbi:hypothetical protein GF380_02115, partial [Candidatus Uhrbacteria bacterium]|nr:hypothetical protein [Candidatus Uhrbacteria bacterium]MBD3284011.1 hypothetical protein [Candidatus Uhrbacteria bacterium]